VTQKKLKLNSKDAMKLVLTMIEPYRSSMQLMRWTVTIAMAMYSAIIITVKENSMVILQFILIIL
jgi:hypothetical protein